MTLTEQIQQYIQLNLNEDQCKTIEDILIQFPIGLIPMIQELHYVIAEILGHKFKRIYMDQNGLVRFELDTTDVSIERSELLKGITNHCTRRSSLICLVTGKRGYRRKEITGNPCLSHGIYVEYLNEVNS